MANFPSFSIQNGHLQYNQNNNKWKFNGHFQMEKKEEKIMNLIIFDQTWVIFRFSSQPARHTNNSLHTGVEIENVVMEY